MEDLQKLTIGSPLIELYTLDCTALGGTVFHFTPHYADYLRTAVAPATQEPQPFSELFPSNNFFLPSTSQFPSGDGGTTTYDVPTYLTFAGIQYMSIPIITEGWEVTSSGTQPRPTLTVSNVNQFLLYAVISLGDIVGAKLTRVRTFGKFLDDGETPNTNEFIGPDIFYLEQKVSHTKEAISWQLSSVIDKFGIGLPRQQITRDNAPGVGRARGAW